MTRGGAGLWFACSWVGALIAPGCRTPTTITIEVRTDIPCSSVGTTRVITGPLAELGTRPAAATRDRCDGDYLGTLVVVPADAKNSEVGIEVRTSVSGTADCIEGDASCVVARRALHFIPHEELSLRVHMRDACRSTRCKPDETCVAGRCVSATIIEPSRCIRPCDETALLSGADAGADALDGEVLSVRYVFVTTADFPGNLGGRPAADATCTAAAASGGLTGTFIAWVSTSAISAKSRVKKSPAHYQLPDGTPVYEGSFPPITPLLHAIDRDQRGILVSATSSSLVWTATDKSGTWSGPDDCNGFTSTTSGSGLGTVGLWSATDDRWTQVSLELCGNRAHLYCVQL